MKRLLAAALTLSLLDATAALAQDNRHDKGHPGPAPAPAPAPRGGGGGGHGGWAGRDAPGGVAAPAPRAGPMAYVPQGHADRPHPDDWGQNRPAPDTHLGRDFGAPGFRPDGADRPRYNEQYFPHQIRPAQRYHWGGDREWAGQPGYYHRHWRYGDFLPDGWFGSAFWIGDWASYDLPVPPYGYEWVRVGPDAVLVDTYSGEVVSTVYGLFY